MKCNMEMTNKRNLTICVFHNGGNYDLPLLLEDMVETDGINLSDIKIMPKDGTSYYNLKYGKQLSFIDSYSFIPSSLAHLVDLKCKEGKDLEEVLPITFETVKKSRFNSDPQVLQYLGKKQIYPYTFFNNIKDFDKTEWPPRSAFKNDLTNKEITEEEHEFGRLLYEKSGCKSLRDFSEFYLMTDCALLADIWAWFSKLMSKDFELFQQIF